MALLPILLVLRTALENISLPVDDEADYAAFAAGAEAFLDCFEASLPEIMAAPAGAPIRKIVRLLVSQNILVLHNGLYMVLPDIATAFLLLNAASLDPSSSALASPEFHPPMVALAGGLTLATPTIVTILNSMIGQLQPSPPADVPVAVQEKTGPAPAGKAATAAGSECLSPGTQP